MTPIWIQYSYGSMSRLFEKIELRKYREKRKYNDNKWMIIHLPSLWTITKIWLATILISIWWIVIFRTRRCSRPRYWSKWISFLKIKTKNIDIRCFKNKTYDTVDITTNRACSSHSRTKRIKWITATRWSWTGKTIQTKTKFDNN